MKKYFVIILILICIPNTIFWLAKNDPDKKKEFNSVYSFKIAKIRVTPTKKLIFYDKDNNEIYTYNHYISDTDGVSVGDSIYKGAKSKFLNIYKKNSEGVYKLYFTSPAELQFQ